MKNTILCYAAVVLLSTGCQKAADHFTEKDAFKNSTESKNSTERKQTLTSFSKFLIKKGNHYSEGNVFKIVETAELKFTVKFDSSAIYQTIIPENQYDINKLYGFSDNNSSHHQFSARFGWRWSDAALRLFAYVYNKGVVTSKELTTIAIGAETVCSIKVTTNNYIFTAGGVTKTVPRLSTTPKAKGYQLYPYFGGDETAPHDIAVWIKTTLP